MGRALPGEFKAAYLKGGKGACSFDGEEAVRPAQDRPDFEARTAHQ